MSHYLTMDAEKGLMESVRCVETQHEEVSNIRGRLLSIRKREGGKTNV